MFRTRAPDRFVGLLAATTVGVYLLMAMGATAAVADAARACAAWPACGDGFALPTTATGALALGHRLAAGVVGLAMVVTLVVAVRTAVSRRVRGALLVAALVYPAQAALGAVVATTPIDARLSAAHLALGAAILVPLVAALAWTLEDRTGDPSDGKALDPDPQPPSGDPGPADVSDTGAVATLRAYVALTKPRLMWLLCLVAGAAMVLAPGPLAPRTAVATLGGGVLAIGASGTFNHVLERDVDRKMNRTSDRPLAVDRVSVRNAVVFGTALGLASLALFAAVNLLAAALGLLAIVFYSVVYTLVLKPHTVQNTVLGGAAGALPALIGWAAVTGSIGLGGAALALVVFCWTPAHFYNLAMAYKEDYARGGFPMLPVVRGETTARKHVLYYLGATLVASGALALASPLGVLYAVTTAVFGAVFLAAVVRLHYERTAGAAMRAFHASNAFLGGLLLAVLLDASVA
ncbi:MAG: heme o synthase [Haloferacaceae archaeon]